MAAISGRNARIVYYASGFGSAGAVVARAKTDSFKLANEEIDITSKDSAGIKEALNDIASKGLELSCSGILDTGSQHRTLVDLAVDAGAGSALHYFGYDVAGFGEFRASFFIKSFDIGGSEADTATFEMALASSGAITFTADA